MNIYNNEKRLKTAILNLNKKRDISKKNKENIAEFLHFISVNGCSVTRQVKYIYPLEKIAAWLNKNFEEATKTDIENLVEHVKTEKKPNGSPKYSSWTQQDYMITIKKFYKWLFNKDKDDMDEWVTPKIVKFIKINKPKDSNKIPSDLLTPKDVKKLAQSAKTLREKAFVLTLYESGARIGEILSLKIKDLTFDRYGVLLNLNGKTGYRKIRIIGSTPSLSQWINDEHPKHDDKEAHLFCNTQIGHEGEMISWTMAKKILNKLKKRANLKKPVNPHHFRHSRATELAEHLSDSVRCNYFGWVQGSNMARIYTHLQDTDRMILELNGIIDKNPENNGQFREVICPRCKTNNSPDARFCDSCGMALDLETAMSIKETTEKIDDYFTKILEDEDVKKLILSKLRGFSDVKNK